MARLQNAIEYGAYRFFEGLISLMPDSWLPYLARGMGRLLFGVLRVRRDVALTNLAQAFPEKTEEEREKIAFNSYCHFAGLIFEFMKQSRRRPEQLEKMITIETPEAVEKYLSDERGIILVAAHFGNWELGIARLATGWKPASVVQKRQRNRKIDDRMARVRKQWNMEIIYSRGAVNRARQALRQNRIVGMLADQDAGRRGIFVPFLNRLASTPGGAAALHLRSGVPIVFAYTIQEGNFKYRLGIVPIAYNGECRPTRENVTRITAEFTKILESFVRKYPEQYFWMHRRWKSRPSQE